MTYVPPSALGPLARLTAYANALALKDAVMLTPVPRRIPPNVWGAAIVGGVLLFELWRRLQEAERSPVQGPPQSLAPGAPAANNRRADESTYPGPGEIYDGPVTGAVPVDPMGRVRFDVSMTWAEFEEAVGDVCGDATVRSHSFSVTDEGWGPPYALEFGRISACGFQDIGVYQDFVAGPRQVRLLETAGAVRGPVRFIGFNVNGVPLDGGPTEAAVAPFGGAPAADPVLDLAGQIGQGLAEPIPRIGIPPIGAPIPRVRDASPVGVGAGGIGVPAGAIPQTPSIGSSGSAKGDAIAQAAAAAAAAAAAVGALTGSGDLAGVSAPAVPTTGAGVLPLPNVLVFPQAVRRSIAAIASEVGRLESKAEFQIGGGGGGGEPPFNLWDAIEAILQFLNSMADGAPEQEWRIREGCPVPLGAEPDDRFIQIPATSDNQAALLTRFDALALLIQAHKDLRGPVCRGAKPTGVSVTVNFRSVDAAGANGRPLRKIFSYRDPSGGSLQSHTAAWLGFSFRSGAVVVSHDGSAMGACKVWAVNAAEGMRVIRHAARECGLNADVDGEFSIVRPRGNRMGRAATMMPQDLGGGAIAVTVRDGSSGTPVVIAPGL